MTLTFLITIFIEGAVAGVFSVWRKKPYTSILLTSILANLTTQIFLWFALNFFFQHYVVTLSIAEFLIWVIESICLYVVPYNRLTLKESFSLSLGMNLASFTLGWFLPI